MRQHIFPSRDEDFVLRDWGGYLCFLGTEASTGSRAFGVTAVVRMDRLIHDPHIHDDSDEIFYVLSGQGRQLLRNADGTDSVYDIKPGDTVYLTKNRWHGTSNFSAGERLDMLLVNYFYDGQSDPAIRGVIPDGSAVPVETCYGSRATVIDRETCGVAGLTGEVLTLRPGAALEGAVDGGEAFYFSVSQALRLYTGGRAEAQTLPRRAQAFFRRGERFRIENPSPEPARVFCLRTHGNG